MVVALEALVQVKHIKRDVIIRTSIVVVDPVETVVIADDEIVTNVVVARNQARLTGA